MGRPRTLKRYIANLKLGTARRPIHTPQEVGEAIEDVLSEDLVDRWGRQTLLGKVRAMGMHDASM